jgi:hypothetical protein
MTELKMYELVFKNTVQREKLCLSRKYNQVEMHVSIV